MAEQTPDTPGQDWCNCQAIPDTEHFPGPWHPKGDAVCIWEKVAAEPVGVPDTQITDDMVERAARQLYGGPRYRTKLVDGEVVQYAVTWDEDEDGGHFGRDVHRRQARRVLSAALAGRTVVELSAAAEHLQVSTSERGFKRLPTLPAAYPGSKVAVYESSAASAAHLWLLVRDTDGSEAHAHLTLATALKVVQQLLATIAKHYQLSGGSQVGDQP